MPEIKCPNCNHTLVRYQTGKDRDLGFFDSLGFVRVVNRRNFLMDELDKVNAALDEFLNRIEEENKEKKKE